MVSYFALLMYHSKHCKIPWCTTTLPCCSPLRLSVRTVIPRHCWRTTPTQSLAQGPADRTLTAEDQGRLAGLTFALKCSNCLNAIDTKETHQGFFELFQSFQVTVVTACPSFQLDVNHINLPTTLCSLMHQHP